MRVTHLHKNGDGFTAKTACGRNIMNTPFSVNWDEFKKESSAHQCTRCLNSKQFLFNLKSDAKKII